MRRRILIQPILARVDDDANHDAGVAPKEDAPPQRVLLGEEPARGGLTDHHLGDALSPTLEEPPPLQRDVEDPEVLGRRGGAPGHRYLAPTGAISHGGFRDRTAIERDPGAHRCGTRPRQRPQAPQRPLE